MENGMKTSQSGTDNNAKLLINSEYLITSTRIGSGVNSEKTNYDRLDVNEYEDDAENDDDDEDDYDYSSELKKNYNNNNINQIAKQRLGRDRQVSNEGDLDLNLIDTEMKKGVDYQNDDDDEEEVIVEQNYLDEDFDDMLEMDLFTNNNHLMNTMNLNGMSNYNQIGGGGGGVGGEDQSSSDTIKINEDDLISKRDSLTELYKKLFFDKNECYCDLTQNIFVVKKTRLSKSILRKVLTLDQLLTVNQQLTPFAENPTNTNDLLKMNLEDQDLNVLIKSSVQNQEYKKKLFRLLRSICERVLIDNLTVCDQFHGQILEYQQQQLLKSHQQNGGNGSGSPPPSLIAGPMANHPVNKLWTEVRNRGCQFLGPQMQEDVLKLILHALEIFTRLSRKVLVLYVVHMLKKHYSRASKTSVGHVIQLLYRAGCFKVEKRENDASLMELKKEYSKYGPLRRQHDAQIIQIALESGIRMSPEQWSQKLYGDSTHKSEMQSIIDKLQSQLTLDKLIGDFYTKLNSLSAQSTFMNNYSIVFNELKADFDYIASINFEKKVQFQQANVQLNELSLLTSSQNKRNSIASNSDSIKSNLNSGGDSMASEDEFNYLANNLPSGAFDFLDEHQQQQQQQQPQLPQAKIIWSLLLDCLRRTINILNVHVDFIAQAPAATIYDINNNMNSINLNKLTTTVVKLNSNHMNGNFSAANGPIKPPPFYKPSLFYNESFSPTSSSPSSPSPVISSSSSGFLVSNTDRLVRMGPNVAIQPPSNKGYPNNGRNNNQQSQQNRYVNKNNNQQQQQQQQQYFNRNQSLFNSGNNNNKMIDDYNGVGYNPMQGHHQFSNSKFNPSSGSNANAKSFDFNSLNYNNFGNNDSGKNNAIGRNWIEQTCASNAKYQPNTANANNNPFNQMNQMNNFNPLRMIQLQEQYEQFNNNNKQYNSKNQPFANDNWSPFSNSSQFIDKKDFSNNNNNSNQQRRFNQLKDN